MRKTVIKASGREEVFDPAKLISSLVRAGAPEEVAADIAARVELEVPASAHTRHIYRLAKKMLRKSNHVSGMRYSIKKAISSLGPSGYPFEKYFAKILAAYGYSVELNRIVGGFCVSHEVDVLASKGDEQCVIECKYHTEGGKATDVKTALYVQARVEDIKKASGLNKTGQRITQGWLVTNTRCTSDAIRFADCTGLKIVSWRHPEQGSLEKLIEAKRLYPVTILSVLKKQSLDILLKNNIVLVQDIAGMDEGAFIGKSGLDLRTSKALKAEADKICPCDAKSSILNS
ncbi:MAG: restriction endonuclease [Thermodesulfovibrionales bacterium]